MKMSDNWESLPEEGNLHVPDGFLWGRNMLSLLVKMIQVLLQKV